MPSETWYDKWLSALSNLKQGLDVQPDGSVSIGLLVAAAGLVAVAIGVAGHTYLKGRGQQVSDRGTASYMFGLHWLLPIAAIVMLPALFYSKMEVTSSATVLREVLGTDESAHPQDVDDRPSWVNNTDVTIDGRQLITVQSQQFAEKERARQDALEEAVAVIRKDFEHTQRAENTRWTLSPALVREVAVKDTWVEPILRSTGVNEFSVYRVYHQVELSPQVREAVHQSWRGQVVESRVWTLGGLLGFLTLLIGTAATYLRLDTLTGGNYRRRLKLASVSLVAAGGLGLAVLLPLT